MTCMARVSLVGGALTALSFAGASVAVAAGEPIDDRLAATLSDGGSALAADVDWASRPAYSLWARVEPESGDVGAVMGARLPVGAVADVARLRWFPGVAADDAAIASMTVDGVDAEVAVDGSIATVTLPAGHGDVVELMTRFTFTAPQSTPVLGDPISGGGVQPSDIGLLARSDDAVMLGHWFPMWVPEGLSADPVLDGFGDIANYPAGTIHALLDVPTSATVVTSGVRVDERAGGEGRTIFTEGAVGLRDLAVVVMTDAQQVEAPAGDVTVVVTAPAGTRDLAAVADEAETAVTTLSNELGMYAWDELDVVSAPLGYGVAGMEWPGMVWIESTVFGGGVPGVGDLGVDLDEIAELLGPDVLGPDSELGDLFGIGDMGLMIETMREWTIAHEVGHMWWHALVGNDSITAPVIDEALAQHSACLVERQLRPTEADAICDVNTSGQFEQMQTLMGVADAPADQASDEFDSSMQYGAVVYGKAPVFYRELEERYGVDETTAALASVVTRHAFGQITPDQLRDALGESLGDPAGVDELWTRWIEEAHGSDDLGG